MTRDQANIAMAEAMRIVKECDAARPLCVTTLQFDLLNEKKEAAYRAWRRAHKAYVNAPDNKSSCKLVALDVKQRELFE